jgi:hypothetical protein
MEASHSSVGSTVMSGSGSQGPECKAHGADTQTCHIGLFEPRRILVPRLGLQNPSNSRVSHPIKNWRAATIHQNTPRRNRTPNLLIRSQKVTTSHPNTQQQTLTRSFSAPFDAVRRSKIIRSCVSSTESGRAIIQATRPAPDSQNTQELLTRIL